MITTDHVIVAIPVKLGRDNHLADCDLARESGPHATLACAKCGRALWMHKTRHDTCGQFSWVTERTITVDQIEALRFAKGVSQDVRVACARALNEFGLGAGLVREAKRACAERINAAHRAVTGVTK